MRGLMMDRPLLISTIIDHAAEVYADREIVTRTVEGPIHRQTYLQARNRSKQLANALTDLGVGPGDRVATIAWNTHRHFELYYAVSGMGAVIHTINPRLHPTQMAYIINHAEDLVLCVDLTFAPLVDKLIDQLPSLKHVIYLTDRQHMPANVPEIGQCYEDLLRSKSDEFEWPDFDENTASALCYTSGTTGDPKGVLYSHRATVLHALAFNLPSAAPLAEHDAMLPVVPQFHVLAWGIPYAAPMNGAKLVMPGPGLDGASLTELMRDEGVTITAGVPTIWHGLLSHWRQSGETIPTLKRVIIGGSAAPRSMIEAFQDEFDMTVLHAWGMTEMSPLGTVSLLKAGMETESADTRYAKLVKQGRPVFGVEMKIVDDHNRPLPHDGTAFGSLKVRGPWIASGYFRLDHSDHHDSDDWFDTGDVATMDADAYMQITDRKKDLIKSGGEWISSIDLENIAMGHPAIAQAAVIGIPDEKWEERPLLAVVLRPDASADAADIRTYLADKVAKWWLPDQIAFVEALPIGATGKVMKTKLRAAYADGTLVAVETSTP